MQKRRGGSSATLSNTGAGNINSGTGNINTNLPMTSSDIGGTSSSSSSVLKSSSTPQGGVVVPNNPSVVGSDVASKRRRRRRTSGGSSWKEALNGAGLLAAFIVLLFFFLTKTSRLGSDHDHNNNGDTAAAAANVAMNGPKIKTMPRNMIRKPLETFPSLSYALENSDLVALYFAASWCPRCTPISNLLDESFSETSPNTILRPNDDEQRAVLHGEAPPVVNLAHGRRSSLSIVFISSCKTEQDMKSYSRDYWIDVPYHSDDRKNLQKKFLTCSKLEMAELGIDRRHEVPTLIVLDGPTHSELTSDGIGDLKEFGGLKALDHWLDLQRLLRELEDKHDVY